MQRNNLIYDGSFDGFLSCIFYYYEFKLNDAHIQSEEAVQNMLFSDSEKIVTEPEKADRVWKGLKMKSSTNGCHQLYYAFLSEKPQIEDLLLEYIIQTFTNKKPIDKDFSNPTVLKINQIAKMTGREKHRMEAFVRFKLTKDGIYFANIEPDFNVLPLISKHFKRRYADQKWIIYDMKRHYGLYYDLEKVAFINLEFPEDFNPSKTDSEYFALEEFEFQKLWKDYFTSTNITSRKNMKLHIRHIPKRYWKYLSEKQP